MNATPEVFAYHDYRAFLRDWYDARKTHGRVSFRGFARRAGIGSPSYLKLVIDGERNLSLPMAERFASACSLDGDASGFFAELVRFSQAARAIDRRDACARLRSYKRYRELHPLEVASDAYHSRWYLPAIREMVLRSDFREEAAWIAAQLVPAIRAGEATRALRTLLELGLLVRDMHTGRLEQGQPLLTAQATGSVHLGNYHREMIGRAAEALELPREVRDLSAVTIAVSEGVRAQIVEAIASFRRQVLELAAQGEAATQVVQLNIQLFPLTRDGEERGT